MTNNIDQFKTVLETEKVKLIADLSEIAKPNPTNVGDWNAVPGDTEEISMREEVADRLEDNEERENTTKILEQRLREIETALTSIENGTFGKCEVCQNDIEADRLEANPAATTCKAHLEG